jgi:enoyl-CoA hydratase/carnithine racemase
VTSASPARARVWPPSPPGATCSRRAAAPGCSRATSAGRRRLSFFFRGRIVDAEECEQIGLVNEVVPDEELLPTARRWAQEIAANAPLAVQSTKRMMRQGLGESYETTVDHLMVHLKVLFGMEDFKEGAAAFMERRDPEFKGR